MFGLKQAAFWLLLVDAPGIRRELTMPSIDLATIYISFEVCVFGRARLQHEVVHVDSYRQQRR